MNNTIVGEYSRRNAKSVGQVGLYDLERGRLFSQLIGQDQRVIDLGCRHGSLTKYYLGGNKVTGVDFDADNLKLFEQAYNCPTVVFDLNDDISKLGQRVWDRIVMSEVLEHLFFPEVKVKQISSLLAPGGVFLGSVPNGFSLINRFRLLLGLTNQTTLGEPTHITHFSKASLEKILSANFEEVKIIPLAKKAPMKILSRIFPGLFAFILVFECRKPRAID